MRRAITLGGFSKTLAANLEVGFIAASPEMANCLADRKMRSTLTTSELGERLVYKVRSEGHDHKHVERLRAKLDALRATTLRQLERSARAADSAIPAGRSIRTDAGCEPDTARA